MIVDMKLAEKSEEENKIKHGLFEECPIPRNQLLFNLGLFLDHKQLSRILLMDHLYKQIVDIHGDVMDFGTRWGNNAALFRSLRAIYEPYNKHRKIIAFDTFTGFDRFSSEDGIADSLQKGYFATTKDYEEYLEKNMHENEKLEPVGHIKKFEICKGNIGTTLPDYLQANPQTIVSLAYFDFDLYAPTAVAFSKIQDRLTKGSIVAFDELNDKEYPGETQAVMDKIGLNNIKLRRYRYASRVSYFIFGE